MKIILASASPRRQELLRYITPEFEVIPADVDETIPDGVSADECAEFLAVKKAMSSRDNGKSHLKNVSGSAEESKTREVSNDEVRIAKAFGFSEDQLKDYIKKQNK